MWLYWAVDGQAEQFGVVRGELLTHRREGDELTGADGREVRGMREEDDPPSGVVARKLIRPCVLIAPRLNEWLSDPRHAGDRSGTSRVWSRCISWSVPVIAILYTPMGISYWGPAPGQDVRIRHTGPTEWAKRSLDPQMYIAGSMGWSDPRRTRAAF